MWKLRIDLFENAIQEARFQRWYIRYICCSLFPSQADEYCSLIHDLWYLSRFSREPACRQARRDVLCVTWNVLPRSYVPMFLCFYVSCSMIYVPCSTSSVGRSAVKEEKMDAPNQCLGCTRFRTCPQSYFGMLCSDFHLINSSEEQHANLHQASRRDEHLRRAANSCRFLTVEITPRAIIQPDE